MKEILPFFCLPISNLHSTIRFCSVGSILSLNQPTEGIYQCIGRNPYGTDQASTVLILPNDTKLEGISHYFVFTFKTHYDCVILPDIINRDIPLKDSLIVIGPNNVTVYEGETIQLHCLTQAGSTVQWLHNHEIINSNLRRRYELLPSGGLRIVSAQKSDSGIYECIASKLGFGTNTAKCYVHIQGSGLDVSG